MTTVSALLRETDIDVAAKALRRSSVDPPAGRAAPTPSTADASRILEQARFADYRMRAVALAPLPRGEAAIDAVLADSFPASDPPPWTLGVTEEPRQVPAERVRPLNRQMVVTGVRFKKPGWLQQVIALGGAALIAVAFAAAILLLGSVLALVLRLALEVVQALR